MADSKARGMRAPRSGAPPPLLNSPWLSHELFAATKKAASAPDGLAFAKKSAVAKVAQELKRGRNYIDHQLRELEGQLLNVTDFLDGTTKSLFTDYGLPEAAETSSGGGGALSGSGSAAAAAAAGASGRLMSPEDIPTSPNSAGLRSKFVQHNFPASAAGGDKSNPLNPMGTAVEDDLASDTPCTTIGLWKYLAAYDIFRDVTLADVEAALQLEDTTPDDSDEMELEFALYKPSSESREKLQAHVLGASDGSSADDFLKARLVAALLPTAEPAIEDAPSPPPPPPLPPASTPLPPPPPSETLTTENDTKSESLTIVKPEPEREKSKKKRKSKSSAAAERETHWAASGVTAALRDAGLLECTDDELQKRMLNPEDDEVSSELRDLQVMLRDHVRRNNEAKRVLRNLLQTTKPWTSQQDDPSQAIEKKYLSMWRRKRELERKKKLKDKKLMRKEGEQLPYARCF